MIIFGLVAKLIEIMQSALFFLLKKTKNYRLVKGDEIQYFGVLSRELVLVRIGQRVTRTASMEWPRKMAASRVKSSGFSVVENVQEALRVQRDSISGCRRR